MHSHDDTCWHAPFGQCFPPKDNHWLQLCAICTAGLDNCEMMSRHFNFCSLLSCVINSMIGWYVKAQRNLIHVLYLSMFMQILLAHFNEEVWEGHHLLFRILWHLLWNMGSSVKRQLLSLHEPVTLTSTSAEVFLTQVSCHPHCYYANHVLSSMMWNCCPARQSAQCDFFVLQKSSF